MPSSWCFGPGKPALQILSPRSAGQRGPGARPEKRTNHDSQEISGSSGSSGSSKQGSEKGRRAATCSATGCDFERPKQRDRMCWHGSSDTTEGDVREPARHRTHPRCGLGCVMRTGVARHGRQQSGRLFGPAAPVTSAPPSPQSPDGVRPPSAVSVDEVRDRLDEVAKQGRGCASGQRRHVGVVTTLVERTCPVVDAGAIRSNRPC